VPLNENEERILQEIERQFHADDPKSAERIRSTSLPQYLARNCRWATLGLLVGLVILVVGFASSWIVGVFGFLIMVASTVVLIQNLRKMGRLGLQKVSQAFGAESLDDFARRLRRRLGRDDD
jgi:Protein of unknown function (DUF3040)